MKSPLFGPDTPGGKGRGLGAWELALRYSGIQAKAPGANFFVPPTPGFVPTFDFHTDEITFGVNWYVNIEQVFDVQSNRAGSQIGLSFSTK